MIQTLLTDSYWLAIVVSAVFYALDYYLAINAAYLYHNGAKDFVAYAGSYMKSAGFGDIGSKPRLFAPRLLWVLLFLAVSIGVLRWFFVQQYRQPEVFMFILGGVLLLEAADVLRHFRNLTLFRHIQAGQGVTGTVEYSRELVHTLQFNEMYGYTALYLFAFLISGSWFVLGGAFTCLVTSRRQRDWTLVVR